MDSSKLLEASSSTAMSWRAFSASRAHFAQAIEIDPGIAKSVPISHNLEEVLRHSATVRQSNCGGIQI
ncbi:MULTISPECIES: hypothetical protein [unclassified Mesorhizobium]|uniref:hypothetical protein n=1 Tax=unclassified Mesorhizobium TaxID=325217 RepID=UPI00113AADD1|nr:MULTISPECIES: hypothetical protein [unclassified Mesorhizobium]TGT25498.1 hypothetical protein EN815_30235 [Mesorhizobium sp. M4B.F.Ca.ET.172.01.1.1]